MSDASDVLELPNEEEPPPGGGRPVPSPGNAIRRLATVLGVTEGQTYTLIIGLIVALVTAVLGVPPALRDRPASAPQASPPASAPAASLNPPVVTGTSPSADVPRVPLPPAPALAAPPSAAGDEGETGDAPAPTTSPPTSSVPSGPAFADGGKFGTVERLSAVGAPGAPDGVAVGPQGEFYVATDNATGRGEAGPSKVLRFSPAGAFERDYEVAGQPDDREHGLKGLVLDGDGRLYLLDGSTGRILRLDPESGEHEVWAKVPNVGSCTPVDNSNCEPGAGDDAPVPRAAAFSESGDLFVADTAQGIIWKVSPFGEVQLWLASRDFASPNAAGPAGLQFDAAGKLVLAVTTSVVALTGAVYVIDVNDDGAAGAVTELFRSAPGQGPSGLALGASGKVYVTLAGANELLVLNPDGTESARVPGTEDAPFDAPAALAFRGRSLLVSNQGTNEVLRVSVEEEGIPLHRPRRAV